MRAGAMSRWIARRIGITAVRSLLTAQPGRPRSVPAKAPGPVRPPFPRQPEHQNSVAARMIQPMTSIPIDPPRSPETTDLERRVLAHERILQSLIAYMSRTEPRFIDHLRERFVEPMAMARHEHDYRDVDDYAGEFIREVIRIGEIPESKSTRERERVASVRVPEGKRTPAPPSHPVGQPERVQLMERGGIWELRVDGAFWGDYHFKEHALAAAALAKLSLR